MRIREIFLKSISEIYQSTVALALIIFLPAAAHSEELSNNEIDDLFTNGRILNISQNGWKYGYKLSHSSRWEIYFL